MLQIDLYLLNVWSVKHPAVLAPTTVVTLIVDYHPPRRHDVDPIGSYSDTSSTNAVSVVSPVRASSPPIKRILFQAEDEVVHVDTTCDSPVDVMMKNAAHRHRYHHNREASTGFGWYLDEEDFNLYHHYFK